MSDVWEGLLPRLLSAVPSGRTRPTRPTRHASFSCVNSQHKDESTVKYLEWTFTRVGLAASHLGQSPRHLLV